MFKNHECHNHCEVSLPGQGRMAKHTHFWILVNGQVRVDMTDNAGGKICGM